MDAINSVKPDVLIKRTAEELKKLDDLKPPEFVYYVKTGTHKERQPDDPEEFWYTRCASILRKAYIEGKIGVGRLATWYGGRKNRGSKTEHHVDAGKSIIRKAIQNLEKVGFLRKARGGGRRISYEGYVFLNKIACDILGVKCELDEKKFERKSKSPTRSAKSKSTTKPKSSKTTKSTNVRTTKKVRRTKKVDKA